MPLPTAIDRFYTADVFMHTWDLARATGQDETLDADFCAELLAGMEPIEDLLRRRASTAPGCRSPTTPTPRTRLLGFIGRDPAWSPRPDRPWATASARAGTAGRRRAGTR